LSLYTRIVSWRNNKTKLRKQSVSRIQEFAETKTNLRHHQEIRKGGKQAISIGVHQLRSKPRPTNPITNRPQAKFVSKEHFPNSFELTGSWRFWRRFQYSQVRHVSPGCILGSLKFPGCLSTQQLLFAAYGTQGHLDVCKILQLDLGTMCPPGKHRAEKSNCPFLLC
jgi:hypothetical protein